MSTFCFIFHIPASLTGEVQTLLAAQATKPNMTEFQTRAALVPYEVEDMALGPTSTNGQTPTDSIFVVYVGAKQADMTLADFFNAVRPYRTSWSFIDVAVWLVPDGRDWWNPRYQHIAQSSSATWMLTNDAKNILYTACTLSGQDGQSAAVQPRVDLVVSCDSQMAEEFRTLYVELGTATGLQRAWRKWSKEVGLTCRVVMLAKRSGGGSEQENEFVLVVRSKYLQRGHDDRIEYGAPAFPKMEGEHQELKDWVNRHTALVEETYSRSDMS
ncbi:predicted protein [Plenodomus lingam JN3]|uniref:Predicted protein n=1 Tax=Leptosphaeria maculans (strain JN3 / isolate v23.1.3 / race Av1-4-5-6-7-8) TaxID=985895 RepID=E5A5P1_LEPMJ|nr:predicted protein [Plenodomus lingam JN3]CBX98939.1 predicted protein [Plenodomus lingam JN3]